MQTCNRFTPQTNWSVLARQCVLGNWYGKCTIISGQSFHNGFLPRALVEFLMFCRNMDMHIKELTSWCSRGLTVVDISYTVYNSVLVRMKYVWRSVGKRKKRITFPWSDQYLSLSSEFWVTKGIFVRCSGLLQILGNYPQLLLKAIVVTKTWSLVICLRYPQTRQPALMQ